jgi:hypothetical protein
MTEGPVLWYLNRSTGVVALVLLTVTTVLGVLALGGRPAQRVPRFVTQTVHRNVAMLAVALVLAHVVSAVVDSFVDIRWWHALVPFTASYQPVWTGLGAVALDLLVVVTVSSLLRSRMRQRGWWALHLTAYALWATSIVHGIGMGTDLDDGMWLLTVSCTALVPMAVAWRLTRAAVDRVYPQEPADETDNAMTMPIRRIP